MNAKTVGIPRAMYYYEYGDIWARFFEALGVQPLVSGKTDARTVACGAAAASSDLCLPVKVMFGHIESLLSARETPDVLFLPNMYYTLKKCYTCPKTIGLSEMIRAVFRQMPPVLSPCFYGNMASFLLSAGRALGASPAKALAACGKAALRRAPVRQVQTGGGPTIALIGHSYVLRDGYLNMNVFEKLREMHMNCVTPFDIPPRVLYRAARSAGYKTPFWTSANRNLGYTKYITDHRLADGFIFLNAFGCGTDSLSIGFCRSYIRNRSDIPAITLSLDEHASHAGFITRLEAFADCLKS